MWRPLLTIVMNAIVIIIVIIIIDHGGLSAESNLGKCPDNCFWLSIKKLCTKRSDFLIHTMLHELIWRFCWKKLKWSINQSRPRSTALHTYFLAISWSFSLSDTLIAIQQDLPKQTNSEARQGEQSSLARYYVFRFTRFFQMHNAVVCLKCVFYARMCFVYYGLVQRIQITFHIYQICINFSLFFKSFWNSYTVRISCFQPMDSGLMLQLEQYSININK